MFLELYVRHAKKIFLYIICSVIIMRPNLASSPSQASFSFVNIIQKIEKQLKVWCVHIFGNTYFKFYFEKSNVDIYCMQIFIGSFVGCREVLRLLMLFLLNGFKVGLCIMAQLYHILVLLVMVTYSTSHTIFLSWFLKLAS